MATTTLTTPDQLLELQLRTALTMEDDSLAALDLLAQTAVSREIKQMFKHHADETKQQVENLHTIFEEMDLKVRTSPSPSTKGISRQAKSLIEKADRKLLDRIVLTSALGNEHYEMAAYEALLVPVRAMGAGDVEKLLQENLDQEVHTSEELRATLERLAAA
jgi:ferritin-like metal-binding protein YciE